tara:strand:- start:214 stop:333 length:120 start_codon:yes stop_codon:yes gene_type:complete
MLWLKKRKKNDKKVTRRLRLHDHCLPRRGVRSGIFRSSW